MIPTAVSHPFHRIHTSISYQKRSGLLGLSVKLGIASYNKTRHNTHTKVGTDNSIEGRGLNIRKKSQRHLTLIFSILTRTPNNTIIT